MTFFNLHIYYNRFSLFCQGFFQTFFKKFWENFSFPFPLDNYSIADFRKIVNPFLGKFLIFFAVKICCKKLPRLGKNIIPSVAPGHGRSRLSPDLPYFYAHLCMLIHFCTFLQQLYQSPYCTLWEQFLMMYSSICFSISTSASAVCSSSKRGSSIKYL